ncbi:MAG: hypothetical protein AAF004_01325 [Pseudomonadota bacterium]
MWKRKLVKIIHSIAGIGYAGGLITYALVLIFAPEMSEASQHFALRVSLAGVSKWLILPSMILVVISGLLAMIVHYPFMNAPWVWLKALTGLLIFEATLASIDSPAQAAKRAATDAIDGNIDLATLNTLLDKEWLALWILLGLSAANVVLAIWRPRFGIRPD